MQERGGREGQQIGNYRFVRLIGHGGFADVYLGEHLYLKTPVAIKLLQAKVVHKDIRKDFLQEAQTIARLLHPHIVRVLDFGVERKTPFLVMEYAPNGTLRQCHPPGAILALTTLVPYVRQIADALQYAHDKGIIHRDVKPENMLIGRNNEILLSDFGVAITIRLSHSPSSAQEIVGTRDYMAPEQISGRPVPATDQYALAVVAYQWLSGTLPFYGASFQRITRAQQPVPPSSLSENASAIPPAVEQVVMRALAKNPEQRFPNVQAFAEALEEVASQEPPAVAAPTRSLSVSLDPLAPTIRVSQPGQRQQQQTENTLQVKTLTPQQTEVAHHSQPWQTPGTSNNLMQKRPFRKRLQIILIVGSIASLVGALMQIVLALWNVSLLQEAGKQIAENRLAINVAFAMLGVEGLNILIGLLVSFSSGMIAGKLAARRSVGVITGVNAGAILYLITFLVSYLPQYPINTTVRGMGAGLVGGSLVLSLVFLGLWLVMSGFIGFLGACITTGK